VLFLQKTDRQFIAEVIFTRVVKNPEERREEILDTAERLFASRGYGTTTINDILGAIGIAKGTFYYYYKSKEEVMDAIIMRKVASQVAEVEKIAGDEYLSVTEKVFSFLMMLRDANQASEASRPDNAEMQQKSLVALVRNLSPVMARVVEQGKREGMLTTEYPLEAVELLLVAVKMIFDESLFTWTSEERTARARAFATTMEASLGSPKGSFNFVAEMLSGYPAM